MAARNTEKREYDLLHGPLLGKVFAFSIPLMLSNLLQVFYNTADMIVVALSGVEGAVGSIGITTALINLMLNIFTGLAVGTSVIVARNIGKGDRDATHVAVHTSVLLSLIAGVICAFAGLLICRTALRLMGAEGFVLDLATLYTRIIFIGTPCQALANNFIAILRARGDTKTPLYILSFTGLVNCLLNLFFVLVLHMSVDGVAYATILSQALSAVLLFFRLKRENSWIRLELKDLKIDPATAKTIAKEGLPASLQGVLFNISNILISSSVISINNLTCPGGSAVIDGNAAAHSLETFIYQAVTSYSQAAVTFTSQHYGARLYKRIGRVLGSCYVAAGVTAAVFAGILMIFRYPLLRLYVSDPLALETGSLRTIIFSSSYYLLAFMDLGSSVQRGLGKSMRSTITTLVGACGLRILWIYTVFALKPTLAVLYISYPVSWGLTALAHLLFSLKTRRELMARPDAVEETV